MASSSDTDASTLNEVGTSNNRAPVSSSRDNTNNGNEDDINDSVSSAHHSLLRLTRRHSLPTSTALSHFLNIFNAQNNNESEDSKDQAVTRTTPTSSGQPPINSHWQHSRSATVANIAPSSAVPGSIENRHRYGHRHTKSAVLKQPVVVKTYQPPAIPRLPTRTGIMNPAVFEVCHRMRF